ncbi:unnamed protein product [Brassica napus]|uniref:mitogen-activated protein kinase n=1 Tax=Brassica napus TaxID=3708 RepID=A0A816UMD2_BRANA|nr:unnamed protein product [Brassica napus]
MEPPNDAEPVENDGGATTDLQQHPPPENICMNISHDGRYIQYNFSGNIFEVTAKYKPLIMLLGRGGGGIVCSGINSETNERVAIKKIMHACRDQIIAKRTLREIKLLRHLEHENMVGIKDIVLPPQRDAFEDVYIAYELMDTDLEKLIKSNQELTKYHHQMMTRTPLFPGRDRSDQLRSILEFLGSPTEDDIGSLNESGKQCLKMLPWFDRQSFFVKFPDVPFLAVLLLEKMLKFDPRKRISVEDALADPYFKTMHNINNEPVCTKLFDFDLEEHPLTVEQIKELIYHEALAFNPEPATVEKDQ